MAARAIHEQYKANLIKQTAAFFPSFDFLSNASRTKSSTNDFDGKRIKNYDNNFRLEAKVSWEVDVWGRLRSTSSAAQSDLNQGAFDLKNAKLSIATRVAQQWIELIALTQQEVIARNQKNNLAQIVERTTNRYNAGLSDILDLRLVETDLATAQATLFSRVDQRSKAARQLEILLGRYPSAEIKTRKFLPEINNNFNAGIPSNLLKNRPDLLSAEEKIIASNFRVKEAESNRLPSLSLSHSTTYQNGKLKDLFDPVSLITSIAGSIIQPIFDGGRRTAIVEHKKAVTDQQTANYIALVFKAYQEVEDTLTSDVHLADQETQLQKATLNAAESERLSQEKYFNGLISILDLLQAQQRFFVAKSRLVNIQKQRLQTRAILFLALGGQSIPTVPAEKKTTSLSEPKDKDQKTNGTKLEEPTVEQSVEK
ncbi:efflux transporter outer membrane subunit [Kiloniella antarctica]|uniref:Efflux transporter outer membrane subunit n=1 Tax=Kiloniella antarctica TaxID=1550907 RepID=A0ABW5BML0_9PROT